MTLMPVMYDLAILCKTGWLLATIATIMSVFMLVIIAIQRYIKVCTQKAHIVTLKWTGAKGYRPSSGNENVPFNEP
jgi:predicted amidohydrolase